MNTTSSKPVAGHGIIPVKYYVAVFAALIVLTIVTVLTAKYVDLGRFNFLLAMIIAIVKATLVFMIFMGLYWDHSRFHIVILIYTFLFFAIFIGITALDVVTRDEIYVEEGKVDLNLQTKVRVEGYFEDVPKGTPIDAEELAKLKSETGN